MGTRKIQSFYPDAYIRFSREMEQIRCVYVYVHMCANSKCTYMESEREIERLRRGEEKRNFKELVHAMWQLASLIL